jgi:uncharacterized protein
MSYGMRDLAIDVLKASNDPLTHQEIWRKGEEQGLDKRLSSVGKTPWQSLAAMLYVAVKDNHYSEFISVGSRPARFFLKRRENELPKDTVERLDERETTEAASEAKTRRN